MEDFPGKSVYFICEIYYLFFLFSTKPKSIIKFFFLITFKKYKSLSKMIAD